MATRPRRSKSSIQVPGPPSFPGRFFIEHYSRLRALSLNDSRNAAIPTGINDQSHERPTKQRAISSPVATACMGGVGSRPICNPY